MNIFVTGTDTGVGKTFVSGLLCMRFGYTYFKPIQTGAELDSKVVQEVFDVNIYPEVYRYSAPLSPHIAAAMENDEIDINKISLPYGKGLIIEGAGGLMVPINKKHFIIDLIKHLGTPVILVSRTEIGTINHTLLSIDALRKRGIEVLGVVLNGNANKHNADSIKFYGNVRILAEIPKLDVITYRSLQSISKTFKI
ncbi:ATP-dependent dethiobiotin synthetase BioD [Candidatus Cyrtobacter comes]|uniref:ATP-dependent dethiobiotin synthetase BioD n=1 Tax=Candidatus Cyrtobacter comes TaxID=675776 RepID=A0ABU5L951_9RICK|nr:dethiobiotin synthase [Candidatus Cyrtobacter comes]MDZ5762645.1 ATP-dependent dethiobiotin synthetase BioD [Candidatus Cyrtobacter comes]